MNKLIKLLLYCFSSVFNFFNMHSSILFVTVHDRAIGNSAEEIYFSLLFAKKFNRKILLLRRLNYSKKFTRTNLEIFHLESEYIINSSHPLLVYFFNFVLTLYWDFTTLVIPYLWINFKNLINFLSGKKLQYFHFFQRDLLFSVPQIGHHQIFSLEENPSIKPEWTASEWRNLFNTHIDLRINSEKSQYCQSLLKEIGISENSWFVCFHVREGGFYNDHTSSRNSNIANCIEAMKYVVSLGGLAIRMGDASMKKLPAIPGVIDYPHTKYKSQLMDLYLIKNCRYYIGTNSGILDVARLFQKKIGLINSTEWRIGIPYKDIDVMIIKHRYSSTLQRQLSLKEVLEGQYSDPDNVVSASHEQQHTYIENSSEEILELTRELIDESAAPIFDELQREASNLRIKQILDWTNLKWAITDKFSSVNIEIYRSIPRNQFSEVKFSKYFLEKFYDKK